MLALLFALVTLVQVLSEPSAMLFFINITGLLDIAPMISRLPLVGRYLHISLCRTLIDNHQTPT